MMHQLMVVMFIDVCISASFSLVVVCVAFLCSLQRMRSELVKKLREAALMTSALESQIKRFNTV